MPTDPSKVTQRVTGIGGQQGLYGGIRSTIKAQANENAHWDKGVEVSPSTHMLPAFGLQFKVQRNINRTRGMFRTNVSAVFRHRSTPSGSGMKTEQAYPSPSVQAWLHQKDKPERKAWMQTPDQVVMANRISQNNMHRATIRPAAPAQVQWKTPYIVGQRNLQPIGPYQSLQQRSILYRLSDAISSVAGG